MEGIRDGNRRHYLSALFIALLMALIIGAWGTLTVHADDGAGGGTGPDTEAAQQDEDADAAQVTQPAPAVTATSNGNSETGDTESGDPESFDVVAENGAKGGESDDTGDTGDTGEVTVEDANTGASDINTDNSVPLEVTNGSATLSEKVLNDSENVNQLAADPENNVESTQQTFTNDVQSVTITETYNLTGNDAANVTNLNAGAAVQGKTPDSQTHTITSTGLPLKATDQNKVDTIKAETTYKVANGADSSTATVTKTTVTKSSTAIQKAIDAALKMAAIDSDETIKYMTITVDPGIYNGDLTISFNNVQELVTGANKNFTLYILAAGSYTEAEGDLIDKNTIGTKAAPNVILNGNVVIDDINVVLAGVYLSALKDVTVKSDKTTSIYGTTAIDTVKVAVASKEGTLNVNTGDGADKVTITTQYNGVDAGSGFGNTVNINTGAAGDSVTLTHQTGVLNAVIDTDSGNDSVAMTCGSNTARSYTKGDKTINSSLAVDLGAGNDSVTVNSNLGAAFADIQLTCGAGQGCDSLLLAGDLKKDGQVSDTYKVPMYGEITRTGDKYSGYVKLVWGTAKDTDSAMKIELSGFDALSDTLNNKPTVALDSLAFASGKAPSSFTNYTYTGALKNDAGLIPLTADWSGYTVVLTNLTLGKSKESVKLGNINLPTVNLTVEGNYIEVSGTVKAPSINLKAIDNDTMFDLMPADPQIDPVTGQSTAPPGTPPRTKGAFSGSLFDFEASAEILVDEGATLEATSGSVTMSATIDQIRSLIDLFGDALAGMNVINVKVGNADITIKGNVKANSNVNIAARSNVTIKASNEMLASAFVPLAVVVDVNSVNINIVDNAKIEAVHGSVKANADSKVSLTAAANTGKLPVSLAVAVGVNDTHIKVANSSSIEAKQGDVSLIATAVTTADAKAQRGALSGDTSAYITAEVVVQDASVEIMDQASIDAGGNITVSSSATQTGMSVATSAKSGAADGSSTSSKEGMNGIKEMFGEIASVFAANAKGSIADLLNGIGQKFGGKSYKIKTDTTEHGSVTAQTSANAHEIATGTTFEAGTTYYTCNSAGKYTKENVTAGAEIPKKPVYYIDAEPVTFSINPDKGYTVDKIEIRYMLKGSDSQSTYTWTQGAAQSVSSAKSVMRRNLRQLRKLLRLLQ